MFSNPGKRKRKRKRKCKGQSVRKQLKGIRFPGWFAASLGSSAVFTGRFLSR